MFTYSTDSEWDRAEAWELGADSPNRAWVLTDRDVWHANPFYKGPPVPHPEDYDGHEAECLADLDPAEDAGTTPPVDLIEVTYPDW